MIYLFDFLSNNNNNTKIKCNYRVGCNYDNNNGGQLITKYWVYKI